MVFRVTLQGYREMHHILFIYVNRLCPLNERNIVQTGPLISSLFTKLRKRISGVLRGIGMQQ